jgi:hypothetical protein
MQTKPLIAARDSVAYKSHLPRRDRQVHLRNLTASEQTTGQIDSVAWNASELAGTGCKRN